MDAYNLYIVVDGMKHMIAVTSTVQFQNNSMSMSDAKEMLDDMIKVEAISYLPLADGSFIGISEDKMKTVHFIACPVN